MKAVANCFTQSILLIKTAVISSFFCPFVFIFQFTSVISNNIRRTSSICFICMFVSREIAFFLLVTAMSMISTFLSTNWNRVACAFYQTIGNDWDLFAFASAMIVSIHRDNSAKCQCLPNKIIITYDGNAEGKFWNIRLLFGHQTCASMRAYW